jgi:hypothetical protein
MSCLDSESIEVVNITVSILDDRAGKGGILTLSAMPSPERAGGVQ